MATDTGPRSKLTLDKMSLEDARSLSQRLAGSWLSKHQQDEDEKKIFRTALVELFADYPLWAGQQICKQLPRKLEWLPSIKQVADALEEEVRVLRTARDWDKATTIKDQPALEGPQPIPREQRPTYEELKTKYGPNWGIDQDDPHSKRKRPPTMEEERAKLIAEFGQDKFDALPDQPEPFARLHYDMPKADQT